ncbi:hypothetical protein [Nocardioides sp. Leaf307]|uniref:hypothetical protein n=1 Tax=Nocardioides sp. Leaf307 TaxID=1736331 RepID=UPI000ABFB0B3|nr:hypothetical protein [Nocardioides sp. Leaf307]
MLLDLDTTGAVVDVDSLEADEVLEYAADTARSVRAAERRTLRVMARWGALNPDRAYAWSVPGMIRHGHPARHGPLGSAEPRPGLRVVGARDDPPRPRRVRS